MIEREQRPPQQPLDHGVYGSSASPCYVHAMPLAPPDHLTRWAHCSPMAAALVALAFEGEGWGDYYWCDRQHCWTPAPSGLSGIEIGTVVIAHLKHVTLWHISTADGLVNHRTDGGPSYATNFGAPEWWVDGQPLDERRYPDARRLEQAWELAEASYDRAAAGLFAPRPLRMRA